VQLIRNKRYGYKDTANTDITHTCTYLYRWRGKSARKEHSKKPGK